MALSLRFYIDPDRPKKGVISEWFTFAAVTRTTYLGSLPTNCEGTL